MPRRGSAAYRWLVIAALLSGCDGGEPDGLLEQALRDLREDRAAHAQGLADQVIRTAMANNDAFRLCEARAVRVLALAAQPSSGGVAAELEALAVACPDRVDARLVARVAAVLNETGRHVDALAVIDEATARHPDDAARFADLRDVVLSDHLEALAKVGHVEALMSLLNGGGVCNYDWSQDADSR